MSDLTLWERIRIRIAYWLLPWDEPDTLTSFLEANAENATLKLAVQAAIDYFTDGITSKEQYDAYLRFVDAAQPFFVVAMATGARS